MTSALGRRLVACLLNISEARNKNVVENVAQAALTHKHGRIRQDATILNIFSDDDYNRSVLTIVASVEIIGEVIMSACDRAFSLIDLSTHEGIHPCMGAVDLIPLYPLGEDADLDQCGNEAQALATALTQQVEGTSVFLFGHADTPLHRGLAQRRKEIGWFRKVLNPTIIQPDVGPPPTSRCGLTGVGASPYVMNCNVTINTKDLVLGRNIAAAIRGSSPGGIPGVQVMALPHKGNVEIACNVESVPEAFAVGTEPWPTFQIGKQKFCHAPASIITARIAELASLQGVSTHGTVLVGYTPLECLQLAEMALCHGISDFWKKQHRGMRM